MLFPWQWRGCSTGTQRLWDASVSSFRGHELCAFPESLYHRIVTNADLKWWYRRYNRRFWGGRLPAADIRFARIDSSCLGQCIVFDGIPEIRIATGIRKWTKVCKTTLLHEMVHVALPRRVEHGPRFEREMRRLASAGAFEGLW